MILPHRGQAGAGRGVPPAGSLRLDSLGRQRTLPSLQPGPRGRPNPCAVNARCLPAPVPGRDVLEPEAAAALASALGASHPYVVEMALAVTHGGALGRCDDDAEFEFALDFILDGLARLRSS